jgi:hypothetical protein
VKKNSHKGWTYTLLIAAFAAALAGCNNTDQGGGSAGENNPPAVTEDGASQGTDGGAPAADQGDPANESTEQQPADDQAAEDAPQADAGADLANLPDKKDLEITLEGMTEKVPAKLMKSDQGYAFYLMDGFEYTPEEPGVDMVFHKNFPDYYMRIEKLPSDFNIDDLKANAEEVLKLVGDVVPMEGEQIGDAFIRENAKFFYHASSSELSRNIIVLELNGSLMRLTLNFPNSEASEGVSPRFFPMIDSLVIGK